MFVEANGAKLVVVPPHTSDFQIDFDALEKAISIHTKGVIINSPNNPSGAVYSKETIRKLAALLTKKSEENGTPIFILADEPYREIAYDGVEVPYVTKYYAKTHWYAIFLQQIPSVAGPTYRLCDCSDESTESKTVYAAELFQLILGPLNACYSGSPHVPGYASSDPHPEYRNALELYLEASFHLSKLFDNG